MMGTSMYFAAAHSHVRRLLLWGGVAVLITAGMFLSASPSPVAAQGITPLTMSITLNPPLPGPYETVTATVNAVGLDVSRSLIVWKVNGVEKGQGVGGKTLTFTTGPIGTATTLEVVGIPPSGTRLSGSLTVRPSSVAILWEAQTYIPPFYKGKALVTPGSTLTLTVVPEIVDAAGKRYAAEELVYKWERGHTQLPEYSGFGKYRITVSNDTFLRPLVYTVIVSTLQDQVVGRGQITIPIAQTRLSLLEDHPLLGVQYENALGETYALARDEVKILVEPYYYSVARRNDTALEYRWGIGTTSPSVRDLITLRRVGNESGQSRLQLAVKHLGAVLQTNRFPLTISYPPRSADAGAFPANNAEPQF